MQVTVTGKHIEITDAIRDYAQDKANKLPRYFSGVSQVDVLVDKRDRLYEVEMIAAVDGHANFVAKNEQDDLYATIDGVADKLGRQLTDHKEKVRSH